MTEQEFKAELIAQYPRMRAVAMSILSNKDDVADALQDSAVALWKHADRLENIRNRAAYFLSTVRNVCYSRVRGAHYSSDLNEVMSMADPNRGEEIVESTDLLGSLLDRLPEKQRKALLLSLYEKNDTEAVAKEMNITKDNVRQLLSRGRRALRELYEREMKK